MKTKDKIIAAAIRCYNEKGLSNVTSRYIAGELGISHGNLEYHFPNKEALLLAIYQQMREDISGFYAEQAENQLNPIQHFHRLLVGLEEFQRKYRFFNLDVLEIFRKYAQINESLEQTFQVRKLQVARLFRKCTELGYMEPERSVGYYGRLQHTIRILITFWKSQEVVLSNFDFQRNGDLALHIWDLLLPHFTKKGLVAYEELITKGRAVSRERG